MKKVFKMYALIWAILLAIFNVICFVTPNFAKVGKTEYVKFGGAFWAGYVFITIAFVGQLICAFIALNKDDNTKLFYNIPVARISCTGLILTIIFGVLCMVIPDLPNWIGIIVCFIVLVFTAIAVIKTKTAADIVGKIDEEVKAKTTFIKSLTIDANSLLSCAEAPESKDACNKVFEAIRYSDPMSNDALADVESQITLKFNEFSNAVTAGNDGVGTIANELVALIGDRNKKCKLLK